MGRGISIYVYTYLSNSSLLITVAGNLKMKVFTLLIIKAHDEIKTL